MKFETKLPGYELRFAEEKDVPLILWFIKESADYEGELHEVTATEEILAESIFRRHGTEVIIGEYKSEPIGFALFHHNFSTFLGRPGIFFVDLYIKPAMRGQGFGTMLLSFLAKLTMERNCGRLEWWCHDWNEPSIKFYKNLDASPLDILTTYRLCGEALHQLANKY